jgi:hypothetical protein
VVREGNEQEVVMNKLRTLALLATVALGLALAGVAQGDGKPLIVAEPFEEVFPSPCTGETVILTGEVLVIVHQTDDGAGGFHEKFTLIPRGITAIGASGTQYRAVGAHSDAFNTGPGRATTFTLSVTFNVISKGGTDNLVSTATVHFTVNANGDPTAEVVEIRAECRG